MYLSGKTAPHLVYCFSEWSIAFFIAGRYFCWCGLPVVTPDQEEESMMFLSLLFWALLASSIVHILDEALLNGRFVQWIADTFWPTYTWRMFFWFNAGAIAAIAISNRFCQNAVLST
jgi:hypothetical protein